MGKQVRERLAQVGRPDLAKDAHSLVLSTFKQMRQQSVIAVFSATEDRDDTIWMPGSMVATLRRAGADCSLDELVVHLIQEYGGRPLFGDKRFVRYKRVTQRELDDGMARMTSQRRPWRDLGMALPPRHPTVAAAPPDPLDPFQYWRNIDQTIGQRIQQAVQTAQDTTAVPGMGIDKDR
ncbi:MAG TPA: hypothetical protein VK053_04645 [Jiangellaceae bacterium]|nr:hypothetical protein [Jiangellaceae bacterium]